MVIKIAIVLVEGLAVVAIDYDQGIITQAQFINTGEQALDTRIHIGDFTVVLRHHKIGVGNARRHPAQMEISEGLECFYRFHGGFGRVARVFAVEHRIVRWRRQIGRVRIHVSQK